LIRNIAKKSLTIKEFNPIFAKLKKILIDLKII